MPSTWCPTAPPERPDLGRQGRSAPVLAATARRTSRAAPSPSARGRCTAWWSPPTGTPSATRAWPGRRGLTVRYDPVIAQECLLHDVLGLRDAPEHPVSDREQQRPEVVERLRGRRQVLARRGLRVAPRPLPSAHDRDAGSRSASACRPRAKPSRHVGHAGSQRSSRLALALDEPRTDVIIATAVSPAASRPSQTGTRNGFFAPAAAARTGSHSQTGAGSSSTML